MPRTHSPAVDPAPMTPGGEPFSQGAAQRLGPPAALTLVAFLAAGSILYGLGSPLAEVLKLLAGCGAIGVGAIGAVGGGRRRAGVLVRALLNASSGK